MQDNAPSISLRKFYLRDFMAPACTHRFNITDDKLPTKFA